MAEEGKFRSNVNKLAVAVAALIIYNLLLTAVVCYAGYYAMTRFDGFSQDSKDLREEVDILKVSLVKKSEVVTEKPKERAKREVISSSKELPDWGRDGGDRSFGFVEKTINRTIEKIVLQEWTKFSGKLSTYGGATYIRWGKSSCPVTNNLLYKGTMAGPDRQSSGGGVNFQCLPSDPEYSKNPAPKLTAIYSDLVNVRYGDHGLAQLQLIPCAVCEAKQRLTKVMIPAKARCPNLDWTVEYVGHLFSTAAQDVHGSIINNSNYRNTYECIDSAMESVNNQKRHEPGIPIMHAVKAKCKGEGSLVNGCPPYKPDEPLSCVVCTK